MRSQKVHLLGSPSYTVMCGRRAKEVERTVMHELVTCTNCERVFQAQWAKFGTLARMKKKKVSKWNGLCPAGKHGLDFEGQPCDICQENIENRNAKANLKHKESEYRELLEKYNTLDARFNVLFNKRNRLSRSVMELENALLAIKREMKKGHAGFRGRVDDILKRALKEVYSG